MFEDLRFQKCPNCGSWLYPIRKFHDGVTGAFAKELEIQKDNEGDPVYTCGKCNAKLVHAVAKGKPLIYRLSHVK
ncbi:MAG: zinc ribbon domain-containing protein [Candidatus Humimicrobiaceae bacterium]